MMSRLNLVYVWILLALVLRLGVSGVMAQTLGNPTFNSINTFAGNVNSTIVDNSGSITNVLVPNANDTTPGRAFDHVNQVFGIGAGATYANNNSRPGEIIREAINGSPVQLTIQNTGSGAASAGLQLATTNTSGASANLRVNNNSGTNPALTLALGSGVSGGASFDASGGGSTAPFALKGGSAAGVTANPFIDLVNAYTVATLPSCTSSLAGALAYVTDASSPTYNSSLTGGSSVKALALCNGSVWTAH